MGAEISTVDTHPMMKCGCVAQGVLRSRKGVAVDPPIPACVVHDCYEVADQMPDLAGRFAECTYLPRGHALKPSSVDLAFFEFRGDGSPYATDICKCGMAQKAHDDKGRIGPRKFACCMKGCAGFTPQGPNKHDAHYCGCHGWD